MAHHNIAEDTAEVSAEAVRDLYRGIREDIEDGDGWNGGDVVDWLCVWFKRHGFDVDGPNPWGEDETEDQDEDNE